MEWTAAEDMATRNTAASITFLEEEENVRMTKNTARILRTRN
jgi:hypothetical protein